MGVEEDVLAGTSGSLLDHPKEFSESRKADEVILTGHSTLSGFRFLASDLQSGAEMVLQESSQPVYALDPSQEWQ